MRSIVNAGLLIGALHLAATAAVATVAPLTPEGRVMMERKDALENAVRARFGDGTFNRVRDQYGSIIVGTERQGGAALSRVLVKDEHGWFELRGSGRTKLPGRIAHELNRLMVQETSWGERPYAATLPCWSPRLFVLRRAGREQFGRQCSASGLAGRVAEVAATFRIPPGWGKTMMPPPPPGDPRPGLGQGESFSRHISDRAAEMVWSWERRSLAGAVDPYAEDVIVELPGRVLRGKPALVAWMRPQQPWSTPGLATGGIGKRYHYHRGELKPPHEGIMFERREIRWDEAGRPMRRTYSATWRNNGGLWQIVHERMSEDKPVTDERHSW